MSQVQTDIFNDVAGVDSFADVDGNRRPHPRWLNGFKMGGSAAIGDTTIELFVETVSLGLYANTSTDDIPDNLHIQTMRVPVPPNAQLRCLVRTAAGSSAFATALLSP